MKIFVHNRQTRRRPNARKLAALARFFMLQAGYPQSECPWAEVSVVLTDDAGIAPVNRVFLDHARATDVITFTLSPLPGGGNYFGSSGPGGPGSWKGSGHNC